MMEQMITNILLGAFTCILLAACFLREVNLTQKYEEMISLRNELEDLLSSIAEKEKGNQGEKVE
jgi:hypothetical protein